ncbi:MAG: ribonuclease H-like domain-containing protein [Candidatus Woesearchaeota archaeon]
MIRSSFIFLERISHKMEQKLWQAGIIDWKSFIEAKEVPGISLKRKQYYCRKLQEARKHLMDHDSGYFAGRLPSSEAWRLYEHFSDDCVFLDIETGGYYGDITVVGMYDGNEMMTLVKGKGLDKHNMKMILSRYKLLVTFNGQSFDVPVINRYFNTIVPQIPHLDLRFPLARLGFSGGLKNIEKALGIARSSSVGGMSGDDAVSLWHEYRATGDESYLDSLVEYNSEDAMNLKPLAEFVSSQMRKNFVDAFMPAHL